MGASFREHEPEIEKVFCRNEHVIGYQSDMKKFVDQNSNVVLLLTDQTKLEWNPSLWKKKFCRVYRY